MVGPERRVGHAARQLSSSFIRRTHYSTINGIRLIHFGNARGTLLMRRWVWAFGGVAAVTLWSQSRIIESEGHQTRGAITVEELRKHDNVDDGVWVCINGQVYDLTGFLSTHPGGANIIEHYAGQNASEIFNRYHASDVFSKFLGADKFLGRLEGELEEARDITKSDEDEEREALRGALPPLACIYNLSDFEYLAKNILPANAWAYYSSAADDEVSLRENHYVFGRIFFRPKVLVDVSNVEISTEFLGVKTDAPFYCSAAAQAKMGNPEGELGIARGCGKEGIIQMISSTASYSLREIANAAVASQPQWFQLYVSEDRDVSYNTIKECEELGMKAIFVTVDTAVLGRREKDLKLRMLQSEKEQLSDPVTKFLDDATLTWKDIDELKEFTDIPIVLKGVQRVEDVLEAVSHGIDAVVLSNHGGRQLDYSPAPVEVLAELMPILREKKLENKIEIYIDGGVRRGTDILKALCLGAKGVGLGRPFLYANSTYGEEGVAKMINLLKTELVLAMKLLGVSNISELKPELLDLRGLSNRVPPTDMLYHAGYEPLSPPKFTNET